MRYANWQITDTLTRQVEVLKETDTEVQVRASSGVIWVRRSELTDVK